jgi:general stress protein 26
MSRWSEVVAEAPALAATAEERFRAHRHAFLATIRTDGSPRVSGIETTFADGELWLGMMPDSRKGADLRRDPRFALHSGSDDPDEANQSAWAGDAKVAGRAELMTDPSSIERFVGHQSQMPPGPFDLFRADVSELTVIRVGAPADHLVIETWREGEGVRRVERR